MAPSTPLHRRLWGMLLGSEKAGTRGGSSAQGAAHTGGSYRAVTASLSSGIMTGGQHRPRIHQEHDREKLDTDWRGRKRKRH